MAVTTAKASADEVLRLLSLGNQPGQVARLAGRTVVEVEEIRKWGNRRNGTPPPGPAGPAASPRRAEPASLDAWQSHEDPGVRRAAAALRNALDAYETRHGLEAEVAALAEQLAAKQAQLRSIRETRQSRRSSEGPT